MSGGLVGWLVGWLLEAFARTEGRRRRRRRRRRDRAGRSWRSGTRSGTARRARALGSRVAPHRVPHRGGSVLENLRAVRSNPRAREARFGAGLRAPGVGGACATGSAGFKRWVCRETLGAPLCGSPPRWHNFLERHADAARLPEFLRATSSARTQRHGGRAAGRRAWRPRAPPLRPRARARASAPRHAAVDSPRRF